MSAVFAPRSAVRSARRRLERLAVEVTAAIRNEARGQRVAAAFYWRRASRVAGDVDTAGWCAARSRLFKSIKSARGPASDATGGRDGA